MKHKDCLHCAISATINEWAAERDHKGIKRSVATEALAQCVADVQYHNPEREKGLGRMLAVVLDRFEFIDELRSRDRAESGALHQGEMVSCLKH